MKFNSRQTWAFLLMAVAAFTAAQQSHAAGSGDPWAKIGKGTLAKMASAGKAVVIVRLKDDSAIPPAGELPLQAAERMQARQKSVRQKLASESGCEIRMQFASIPYLVAEVDYSSLGALAAMDEVVSVETDKRVQVADAESNAVIGATHLQQELPAYTGTGVNIGIIDTGLDLNHIDLQGSMTIGRHFFNQGQQNANVADDVGHGSHVSGIITGDGHVAPKGIAPGAKLVVVKAVDASGGWVSDVAAGIDWIIQQNATLSSKVRFINMSLFFVCADDDPSCLGELPAQCPCDTITGYDVFKAALLAARNAGITIVAAAGNDGETVLRVPACLTGVVSVGATFDKSYPVAPSEVQSNPSATFRTAGGALYASCRHSSVVQPDWLLCFSNRNPVMDFVAPGYLITSVKAGDNANNLSSYGTSQATAHVTGALALLQQAAPTRSSAQLLQVLHRTATRVPENPAQPNGQKYDRVNVYSAVKQLLDTNADDWMMFH